jgi:hypothetical protein
MQAMAWGSSSAEAQRSRNLLDEFSCALVQRPPAQVAGAAALPVDAVVEIPSEYLLKSGRCLVLSARGIDAEIEEER